MGFFTKTTPAPAPPGLDVLEQRLAVAEAELDGLERELKAASSAKPGSREEAERLAIKQVTLPRIIQMQLDQTVDLRHQVHNLRSSRSIDYRRLSELEHNPYGPGCHAPQSTPESTGNGGVIIVPPKMKKVIQDLGTHYVIKEVPE